MTKEQTTILSQIYNTLLLISTKGEDTLVMAECLKALQSVVENASMTAPEVIPTEEAVENGN